MKSSRRLTFSCKPFCYIVVDYRVDAFVYKANNIAQMEAFLVGPVLVSVLLLYLVVVHLFGDAYFRLELIEHVQMLVEFGKIVVRVFFVERIALC